MTETTNVNLEGQLGSDVNTSENVNLKDDLSPKLTIRVSKQARDILLYLYKDFEHVHKQVEIIKSVYGEVTPSRKASVSRSIKVLMEAGLVESRKAFYSEMFSYWLRSRIYFFLTEVGKRFVEENLLKGEKKND